jgi:hypothetical protein
VGNDVAACDPPRGIALTNSKKEGMTWHETAHVRLRF